MNSQELISIYENVSNITAQMVNAAQHGDWALLSQLEEKCTLQVDAVKSVDTPVTMGKEEHEKKVRVIQKILEDDRKIRDITEPRLAQLGQLIRRSAIKRKLNNSYQLDHRSN